MRPSSQASNGEPLPEPWITKKRLAEHLSVTTRWIELQQQRGLPHWLSERYSWPQAQ
jgi:hypothetical protein